MQRAALFHRASSLKGAMQLLLLVWIFACSLVKSWRQVPASPSWELWAASNTCILAWQMMARDFDLSVRSFAQHALPWCLVPIWDISKSFPPYHHHMWYARKFTCFEFSQKTESVFSLSNLYFDIIDCFFELPLNIFSGKQIQTFNPFWGRVPTEEDMRFG